MASPALVLPKGLVQGLRLDIVDGLPSFRVEAGPEERADIIIDITATAARRQNRLRSADPALWVAIDRHLGTGEMTISGDPPLLSEGLAAAHDPIVGRAAWRDGPMEADSCTFLGAFAPSNLGNGNSPH